MTEPQGPAWDELTVRVNNLLANLVPDGGAQVEIVFFGRGLDMLRKTTWPTISVFNSLLVSELCLPPARTAWTP